MKKTILGCGIDFTRGVEKAVKESLKDGMKLSAVSSVTGVNPSTIQNWVKRGYIPNPDGKKYSASLAAQIILLNNMKNSVELCDAAKLLKDTEGDRVGILCVLASALIRAKRFNSTDESSLRSVINIELREAGIKDDGVSKLILVAAFSSLSADYSRLASETLEKQ